MLFEKDGLLVRLLAEGDLPFLARWLSDPRVLEFYEGRDRPHTLESVRDKYMPRQGDPITACLVERYGRPLGYIQYYVPTAQQQEEYGYSSGQRVFGIDLYIGEPEWWNQGIGTALVRAMAEHLAATRGAQVVVLDPRTENGRAIRCYEKAGFRRVKLLPRHELHEGALRDCWLMEYLPHKSPLP
ncbi:MAG: GNAT family N-acetyltransferase [Chloroflexi bacterium]|nr:GNAT family N-acetyltransferase [Chloroflexota bacterium]